MEIEINMKKVISTKTAPKAIGPYSQAILNNGTLYCSCQIAINPKTGNLVMRLSYFFILLLLSIYFIRKKLNEKI